MKFMVFVFLVVLSVVRAQFNYLGFNSPWSNAFAPPSNSFGSLQAARDPRLNTGPVVFPSPPPNAIEENSGVVVGASGYGFVPPNSQGPQLTLWHKVKMPKNSKKKPTTHGWKYGLENPKLIGKWTKGYGKKHHHTESIPSVTRVIGYQPHFIRQYIYYRR